MDTQPAGYSPIYEPAYIQKPRPKMKRLTKLVISLIIICAVIVTGELSFLYINSSGTGHNSIASLLTDHNAAANAVITYDTDGSINELRDIQNKKPHKLKIAKTEASDNDEDSLEEDEYEENSLEATYYDKYTCYSPDGKYYYFDSDNGFRRIRVSEIGKNYSLNAKLYI